MTQVAKTNWLADCVLPSMNACNYWIKKYNIKALKGNGTGSLPDRYMFAFQSKKMGCLNQGVVCKTWKALYGVEPFVTYGTLPKHLVKYWTVYQCDFRITPFSPLQCEIVISKYGNDTSKWTTMGRGNYIPVNDFIQVNYDKYCRGYHALADPFDTTIKTANSAIVLTSMSLNVSVSMVEGSAGKTPLRTDGWSSFGTVNGPILRCGNGTYISPGVISTATLLFLRKYAVQITISSHWSIGGADRFAVGYLDNIGMHQLMEKVINGTPVYGASGKGQLSTSYVFFPDGDFRLLFVIQTGNETVRRKGVTIDSLSAKGFQKKEY
jgi:hypothetical protein